MQIRPHRRSGFTLLELILALVVLTTVAVVAIALHFGRPEVSLVRAAKLFAADLRTLQSRAICEGRPAAVRIDPRGLGWTPLPPDDDLPPRLLGSDAIFEGVRLDPACLPQDGVLRFDSHGTPDETLHLRLGLRDHNATIVVEVDRERALVSDPR